MTDAFKMRNKTTLNYVQKIKDFLPLVEFESIALELFNASDEELESFWEIIYAGYPVEFAVTNYVGLCKYVKTKKTSYSKALKVAYQFFPELNDGVFVRSLEWYELN